MTAFTYTITDPVGIHARPAGLLVKKAKEFPGTVITMDCKGKSVSCLKLMGVMSIGVKTGDEVTIKVEGENEAAAAEAMQNFFKENL